MPWNTTTAPVDKERIRKALKIPAEKQWMNLIQMSMDRVEREVPEAIPTVQEYLDQLEGTKDKKRKVRTSESYTMTRADVVEWGAGTPKDSGLVMDEVDLRLEIAQTLLIEPPNTSTYGMLERS